MLPSLCMIGGRGRKSMECHTVSFAAVLAMAALLWGGCAPSLATLQPAHVAPKGHVQVTAGMEVGIPTGTITKAVDAARTLAGDAKSRMLSDAETVRLFDAAVNLATSPPSLGPHFAVAYSVLDRTEVGIRYAGGGWRLGGRYQFLRHDDGPFDLVVGLGVTRATNPVPLGDVVPGLEAQDFTRWTVDCPLLIGTSRDWFRAWTGPKVLYSRFDTGLTVTLPFNDTQAASIEGHAFYLGGQGGLAVGYRNIFFGVELTLGELWGSARSTTTLAVSSHTTDISGFVIYPAFALMGEF